MSHMIKIGHKAPLFEAQAYWKGQKNVLTKVSSTSFAGKWICLFFYPMDFTFVCPTEIQSFQTHAAEFEKLHCQVIGCSTDTEHCHQAWFTRDLPEVKYPVLADPTHAISKAYHVLIEEKGIALRGTFLIDPHGVLQWFSMNSLSVGRAVDEIVRTLTALQTGELCPSDWKPGQATLK